MKKLIQKVSFASLMLFAMAISKAHAVSAPTNNYTASLSNNICDLVAQMGTLFKTLRTLAFIGAAFIIAGWAWGYISSGKVELKDVKEKGVGMLVGFVLLFTIGALISVFMPGGAVCPEIGTNW